MIDSFLKDLESSLTALTEKFKADLRSVRSTRPSVEFVENVPAEYYGQILPIKQLGSLGIRPPRDIEITVWDKNAIQAVVKAIEAVSMGFSVTNDGNVVRASLPPLTDERRAEFGKIVRRMAEETRIQIRNHRDETIKKLKAAENEGTINEDDLFTAKERVQKLVDDANTGVEEALDQKIKELSE